MHRIIKVVFTKRPLDMGQALMQKPYRFLCEHEVNIGDMLDSPVYSTPCQVIGVKMEREVPYYDGKKVKTIAVDKINGKLITSKTNLNMTKDNSMLTGIMASYTSQFVPKREENVRLSMSGLLCVPAGDYYVGCDANNTLVKFHPQMTLPIPVFSIDKPVAAIVAGDIIVRDRSYAKVLGKTPDGRVKILSFSGVTTTQAAIQDFLLQQATFRVLVNMFNFDQNSGFNPFVYAMCSGEEIDFEGLMMVSMTPQGRNLFANSSINPMMLMMLDKNKEGSSDAMRMMAMASMFGGGMQGNPFGNMFGQGVQQPVPSQPVGTPIMPQPVGEPIAQPIVQPEPPVEKTEPSPEDALRVILSNPDALKALKDALKEEKEDK